MPTSRRPYGRVDGSPHRVPIGQAGEDATRKLREEVVWLREQNAVLLGKLRDG
jgi:hypothetical protein